MFRTIVVSAALAIASLCTGCASIVSGNNQSLSVTTTSDGQNVDGAKCTLMNDKGSWFATTPGSVTVRRSYQDLHVSCELKDLEPGKVSVKSATKAMVFGNIIFGGAIGATVDVASGAAYDYPNLITVAMPSGGAAALLPIASRSIASTVAPDGRVIESVRGLLGPGTLLVYREREPISGVDQGETIFTVAEQNTSQWIFNQGAIVTLIDGTPVKGAMHGTLLYGVGPKEIARGGSWGGSIRAPYGTRDLPVTFTLLGKQLTTIAGRQFNAAKLRVEGYASREIISGTITSTQLGAPIEGDMLVDVDTGLILSVSIDCRHPAYILRRNLVRITAG